jgi:predicted acylesterase/phospholipase RssA
MNIFLSPFVPNNWWNRFYNYLSHGCTIQIEYWRNLGFSIFGDITFLEAYELTGSLLFLLINMIVFLCLSVGRVLNITTSQVGGQGGSFILHYKNAPHFLISTAVLASSSFPYMCCPVYVLIT